jgi:hypothetical protein
MIRILSNYALPFAAILSVSEPAAAQKILLQLKPHVGDTIRMHLTQTIEMSGRAPGSSGDAIPPVTTSTDVFSRAIPYQWAEGGTLIHAITDSITAPTGAAGAMEVRRLAMPVKPAVLRVSLDGAMEVVDDGDPNSEVRHIFSEMPAMLTGRPVSVGEQWSKEMRLPAGSSSGPVGTLKAVMHFDSLSRNSEIAYISIKGTVSRVKSQTGTFVGSLQIDRALGWITDARTTISMRSRAAAPKPVQVRTRVTVWSRAVKGS